MALIGLAWLPNDPTRLLCITPSSVPRSHIDPFASSIVRIDQTIKPNGTAMRSGLRKIQRIGLVEDSHPLLTFIFACRLVTKRWPMTKMGPLVPSIDLWENGAVFVCEIVERSARKNFPHVQCTCTIVTVVLTVKTTLPVLLAGDMKETNQHTFQDYRYCNSWIQAVYTNRL